MKSKSTILWFMLAAALAMAIWVLNTYFSPGAPNAKPLLAGLRADLVSGVRVIPAGVHEISVTRTNRNWFLEKPLAYPAQSAAIDGLVEALTKLTPVLSFTAGEMSTHKDADAEFGFDNPQYTVDVVAGDRAWHLRVGNKTATGDGVYVRSVGAAGAAIVETGWLQFLPHAANDWRDTTLVNVPIATDWLVITNGTQVIELRRDATNRLWRLVRPLPARANNLRITEALGQLNNAKVSRFITDDPKADLTAYGLEPAALDVWLGSGTNLVTAIHGGKEVSGMPGEMYARREGLASVVSTPKESLAAWRGLLYQFRDPNLVELTAPVTEIEMHGPNKYTLQWGANGWSVAGQKFAVDGEQVTNLMRTLTGLRITDFVQDAVTASVLQSYGLTNAVPEVTLRAAAAGDTNRVLVQLFFGSLTTNKEIYVKRGDEDFVYQTPVADLNRLTLPGDFYRVPQIWQYSETNVAEVTLRENGKVRQLIRNGPNNWSLAPGSSGIIEPHAVEEAVHRLGDLRAEAWFGRTFDAVQCGMTTNSLSVTVELKTGEKETVDFGTQVSLGGNQSTPVAAVTLDGERWAFLFPRLLWPFVAENLSVPADAP